MDADILNSYLKEGSRLLLDGQSELEKFNTSGNAKHIEEISLLLGKLSGTSAAVNLQDLATLTKMGKDIGLKASQMDEIHKLLAISVLFSQLLKFVDDYFRKLRKGEFDSPEGFKILNNKLKAALEALVHPKSMEKM